jgi:uncharacterized protein (DUF4415 family)
MISYLGIGFSRQAIVNYNIPDLFHLVGFALPGVRLQVEDFGDSVAGKYDWSGAEIGKFYRPVKKPVTMRLDSDIIDWLKADGGGYQTKANWLLRHAMLHFTKRNGLNKRKRAPRVAETGDF